MIQPWLGSTEEAQFFQVILRLMNAKRASQSHSFLYFRHSIHRSDRKTTLSFSSFLVEIGTFTGYTSLAIALALPSDGQLITCDINDQYIRQDVWVKAGIREKIDLRIRPALETLKDLLAQGQGDSFDFIFLDGDKPNYPQYYDLCLQLLRPNGVLAIDNTLWNGRVLDEGDVSAETVAIRQTNELVKDDPRIDLSFLRLGDGTTLCRKK